MAFVPLTVSNNLLLPSGGHGGRIPELEMEFLVPVSETGRVFALTFTHLA